MNRLLSSGGLLGIGAALLVPALAGCGGPAGPPRYTLSGTVTHGGKAVPAGRIVFEPDGSKGNSGPAAYAEIEGGRFQTPSGKGTIGGPHRVRIAGFDGSGGGESPEGRPLFAEFLTTAELPKENGTRDFDVPATHR